MSAHWLQSDNNAGRRFSHDDPRGRKGPSSWTNSWTRPGALTRGCRLTPRAPGRGRARLRPGPAASRTFAINQTRLVATMIAVDLVAFGQTLLLHDTACPARNPRRCATDCRAPPRGSPADNAAAPLSTCAVRHCYSSGGERPSSHNRCRPSPCDRLSRPRSTTAAPPPSRRIGRRRAHPRHPRWPRDTRT